MEWGCPCFLALTPYLSRLVIKPTKWHVSPLKTQISLGIHPAWSESSLSAWRKIGSLATHWAHSEDSDQIGRMPRLIWNFAGRTCHFVGFVMMRLNFMWWFLQCRIFKFGRTIRCVSVMFVAFHVHVLHQSFVVPAPTGPGNSRGKALLNALLNALHCGDKFMVKSLLKAPAPYPMEVPHELWLLLLLPILGPGSSNESNWSCGTWAWRIKTVSQDIG